MRLGMPNASVRRDPWSGTRSNPRARPNLRKRPIQADRHPGVRLRHLGSDPAWRGLTPDVGREPIDPRRRYLVTRRGNRVYNSFPVRYYEPGTLRAAHPNAGPAVRIPNVLTPALDGQAP
jgi:hypothetical protein